MGFFGGKNKQGLTITCIRTHFYFDICHDMVSCNLEDRTKQR